MCYRWERDWADLVHGVQVILMPVELVRRGRQRRVRKTWKFRCCTAHPNGVWGEQQARRIMWELTECEPNIRFLIRHNDKKLAGPSPR
jgi:hypothetical protein